MSYEPAPYSAPESVPGGYTAPAASDYTYFPNPTSINYLSNIGGGSGPSMTFNPSGSMAVPTGGMMSLISSMPVATDSFMNSISMPSQTGGSGGGSGPWSGSGSGSGSQQGQGNTATRTMTASGLAIGFLAFTVAIRLL